MSNLQAALGLGQLSTLDHNLKKKRSIGETYHSLLEALDSVSLPLDSTAYASNLYWVFGLVLKDNSMTAAGLAKLLSALGIGTRPFFYPIHLQPVFREMGFFADVHAPVSENLSLHGLYLPSGLSLSTKDQETVAKQLMSLF